MKSKYILQNFVRVPALFFLLTLAAPLFAADKYLAGSKLDGIALLAPPPALNSPEQAADLELARSIFHGKSAKDEARATKHANLVLFNFTPAIGEFFQPGKFPKLEQFYENLKPQIRPAITAPKDHWKRQRPYQLDRKLWLGKPEASFSYPSGHSSVGTIQALLLAEIFPEKREAILEIGREIGWDRIVIGKHFLTDVRAGRVLGQAIFRELMKNSAFQQELAEVKAEVQAARPAKLEAATATP